MHRKLIVDLRSALEFAAAYLDTQEFHRTLPILERASKVINKKQSKFIERHFIIQDVVGKMFVGKKKNQAASYFENAFPFPTKKEAQEWIKKNKGKFRILRLEMWEE